MRFKRILSVPELLYNGTKSCLKIPTPELQIRRYCTIFLSQYIAGVDGLSSPETSSRPTSWEMTPRLQLDFSPSAAEVLLQFYSFRLIFYPMSLPQMFDILMRLKFGSCCLPEAWRAASDWGDTCRAAYGSWSSDSDNMHLFVSQRSHFLENEGSSSNHSSL